MSKGRLEAFSDGVLAVAITLLVLNLHVPSAQPSIGGHHAPSLGHQLVQMWPQYAAYVTSFLTIGIIWVNHHAMISRLREADHVILILNLFLLMSIAVLPFATDLMAQYLKASSGQHLAAAVYSGAFVLMSICFSALNRHILFMKVHLLKDAPSERWRRTALRRSTLGLIPYLLATALAAVSPYLTLAICGALAVFYALPFASGQGVEA
jgi:TMEM175 potassium channel family protein